MSGVQGCSMPGTHDRLEESAYFHLRMLERYHFPTEFRWNLHAFLQAISSFAQIGLMESQADAAFEQFREELGAFTADVRWKNLIQLRNQATHKEPLLSNATISIGMYRNMRMKLAFTIPLPSHLPSWRVIAKSRNEKIWVPPHREWIGEECGLERAWRLPQFEDELGRVCADTLIRCSQILRAAPGHDKVDLGMGEVDCQRPRMLFEHELFPEILRAWEGVSPHDLLALLPTPIRELPEGGGKILRLIPQGARITAWIEPTMKWDHVYSSLLIQSVDGNEILEDTAGFYVREHFQLLKSQLPAGIASNVHED